MQRPWRSGIDVGGTVTDGVIWNEATGVIASTKVLSTPEDSAQAFLTACERLIAENEVPPSAISYLVHGTTIATNAVLQHGLARTAFVTTKGFGDLLEIARQVRPDPYDVFAEKPRPLTPRHLCFEIQERLGADGEVIVPLDESSVAEVIGRLRAAGVDAIAICLLHAYRNPMHERRAAELIRQALPGKALSLSSDLASEFREFPRACTAIVNAGLTAEVSGYLARIDEQLAARDIAATRLVMQSNGGVSDFLHSAERPVHLIESGPAAGVVGATHIARELGEDNIISFDMGGTTAKVGLVQQGTPHVLHEIEIGSGANRSRAWFSGAAGYPILTPAIDLIEIGTGGGSTAWFDDGAKLRVGPKSAGADPGPACYGLGGTQATVTDADLLLGRLNPDYFLAGQMPLDVPAAQRAVAAIARGLDMDPIAAAVGIVNIADAAMGQALRVVSLQRGYDPKDFKLVAFGGAGPMHALAVAAEIGIESVLVPPKAGIFSAFGLLVADLKHDFAATRSERLDRADPDALESVFAELLEKGRETLAKESVPDDVMEFERALDVRYVGQSYQLTVPLADEALTEDALADVRRRFNETHMATYGYAERSEPCELVCLRVSAVGRISKAPVDLDPHGKGHADNDVAGARKGRRRVYFDEGGFVDCDIYDRLRLPAGAVLDGPAVIEEPDSTTLMHPGWRATVAKHGVLIMTNERETRGR